jgi:hypothetical protein
MIWIKSEEAVPYFAKYVGRMTDDAASRVKYVLCFLYHADPLQMMQVSKHHDIEMDDDATMTQ